MRDTGSLDLWLLLGKKKGLFLPSPLLSALTAPSAKHAVECFVLLLRDEHSAVGSVGRWDHVFIYSGRSIEHC